MRKKILRFFLTLMVLLSLIARGQANTIYFAAFSDVDMTAWGGASAITTAASALPQYNGVATLRTALAVPGVAIGNTAGWVATNKFSVTSAWIRFYVNVNGVGGFVSIGNTCVDFFALTDAVNIKRLVLNACGSYTSDITTPGNVTVQTVAANGTHTQIGSPLSVSLNESPTTPDVVSIQVINYGPSGTLNIYVNNTLAYTYTGDLHTDSNAALNGIIVSQIGNGGGGAGGGTQSYYSGITVTDFDPHDLLPVELSANGNGPTQQWSCNGTTPYQSINQPIVTDLTTCTAPSNGQTQEFGVTPLSGSWNIFAVAVSARAASGFTGPQNIQLCLGATGSQYCSSNIPLGLVLSGSQIWWYNDPATSAPFTPGNINNPSFNIGVTTQP